MSDEPHLLELIVAMAAAGQLQPLTGHEDDYADTPDPCDRLLNMIILHASAQTIKDMAEALPEGRRYEFWRRSDVFHSFMGDANVDLDYMERYINGLSPSDRQRLVTIQHHHQTLLREYGAERVRQWLAPVPA